MIRVNTAYHQTTIAANTDIHRFEYYAMLTFANVVNEDVLVDLRVLSPVRKVDILLKELLQDSLYAFRFARRALSISVFVEH